MVMPVPNWKDLRDAYGSAEELPDLLAELEPDPQSPVWGELWGRVCHQYSTFSASPHVLPFLLAAASGWEPTSRAMPLALAGSIVSAPETNLEGYGPSVEQLRILALETLESRDLSRSDRIYVMQSAMAFEGDRVWGHALERLNDGEFSGECPNCGSDVYVVIGQYGSFCSIDDWVRNPKSPRTEIAARTPDELTGVGRMLYARCVDSGDSQLGEWICQLFGTGECLKCGQSLDLAEVVAAFEAG